MKRYILSTLLIAASTIMIAQAPYAFNYQAILRNEDGTVRANEVISLQISIVNESGSSAYLEIHNTQTNEFGLVNVVIGEGTTSDDLSSVDWTNGPYFLDIIVNGVHLGSSPLLSIPYALHAKTAETITNLATNQIGDLAQGGIVFSVDETGQRGLVCAKEDQSAEIRWYAGTYCSTQAKGDGPYAGEANTAIIIAAQAALGDDGSTYAARICNELQITEGGITYGDWYLPSKEELNQMYENRAAINATATANGGSPLHITEYSDFYWSSTESGSNSAWMMNFHEGFWEGNYGKSSQIRVRAIRAF